MPVSKVMSDNLKFARVASRMGLHQDQKTHAKGDGPKVGIIESDIGSNSAKSTERRAHKVPYQ
jgi:hypothetical protein